MCEYEGCVCVCGCVFSVGYCIKTRLYIVCLELTCSDVAPAWI